MSTTASPQEFLTSADVARLLGVGPTSVKRWADSGLLPCLRTPGRHRRFAREDVDRFRRGQDDVRAPDPAQIDAWIRLLHSECGPYEVHSALLFDRSRFGSWWQVAELIGAVLGAVGESWQRGEITVLEEHTMSERLSRGLARCSESLAVPNHAPRALLATAEGEDHTLALSLVELCLREAGWGVTWGGRALPTQELIARLDEAQFSMLALSASPRAGDAAALAAQVGALARACAERRIRLVLGGSGSWPEPRTGDATFVRVYNFRDFHRILSEIDA